jgi:SAM-dependent methyltransferase
VLIGRLSEFHHTLIRPFVAAGDVVVDCTLGNGHDALFLAEAVGTGGHIFGFDLQEKAVERARGRLLDAGIEEGRFTFFRDSHEKIAEHVAPGIGAAVYNLGYLPGGDRAIVTERTTTIRSVKNSLQLLRREGVVALTLYNRQVGGKSEAEGVVEYASTLDFRLFKVLHLRYPNLPNDPPAMVMIQRTG